MIHKEGADSDIRCALLKSVVEVSIYYILYFYRHNKPPKAADKIQTRFKEKLSEEISDNMNLLMASNKNEKLKNLDHKCDKDIDIEVRFYVI